MGDKQPVADIAALPLLTHPQKRDDFGGNATVLFKISSEISRPPL
jgi:hypothetical protein